jgi:hypothetical protein
VILGCRHYDEPRSEPVPALVHATDPKLSRFLKEVRDKSDDWRPDDRSVSCRAHQVPPAVMDVVWPDWKAWRVSCLALGSDHERDVEIRLYGERTQMRLLESTVTAQAEPTLVLFAFRFEPAATMRIAKLERDGVHLLIDRAIDRSELPSATAMADADLTYMRDRYLAGTDGIGYAYRAIDDDLEMSLTIWSWNGEPSHWVAFEAARARRDRPGTMRTRGGAVTEPWNSPLREQPVESWPEPVWTLAVRASTN